MLYKTNWLEVDYDASFRVPLFVLAGNPAIVMAALHSKLATKYSISANDMIVDSGRSLADVRARVSMFSGNGTLEIRADGFSAKFVNPLAAGDFDTIKDCILLTHDALSGLNKDTVSIKAETVSVKMFIELVDTPLDGPMFLRALFAESKFFGVLDGAAKVEVIPGFQLEFLQDEEKWFFNFNVGRAYRSRKELFVVTNTRFDDGNPFQTVDQKAEHLRTLIRAAFARAELQPQPVEKK